MNQRGIAPLIIVAVIVVVAVVAGAGIYVATRGGGGGNVAGATSLRFNLDITAGETSTTGTVMVKNIGTNNMMLRMEGTLNLENYIWIMNEAQQKVWMYSASQWTDLSTDFSTYWSEFNQSFENYQTQLGGWTGSGEYTYTDPTSGATERFYDIEVNPELADSLFQHEGGGGAQTWTITTDSGHTATLTVDSSGSFTGTGWMGSTPSGSYSIPITDGSMYGTTMTFTANATYDSGQGTIYETGHGTMNASFPDATSASGTCDYTISDPLGDRSGSLSWTATRIS